ncbi:hypothetical protein CGZ93_03620 [Enemella dayhoffiae]|uniref:Uncharacterized protein n=1 Tax=Enemella dayhoffiae TaxID=2016507 RepID=A0A255H9J6_9ACTN|nr:hypothetical protein CGZ93_03620 [Enemella dayhoffiae]
MQQPVLDLFDPETGMGFRSVGGAGERGEVGLVGGPFGPFPGVIVVHPVGEEFLQLRAEHRSEFG